MPTFLMKLLFYYPFFVGGEWKSFMVAYGFVVLGFLRRQRQPHLELLPVPIWSPDSEGRHHGEMIPCPLTYSPLHVTAVKFFHCEFNCHSFRHLANFYFMVFDWISPMCQVLKSLTSGNLQSLVDCFSKGISLNPYYLRNSKNEGSCGP